MFFAKKNLFSTLIPIPINQPKDNQYCFKEHCLKFKQLQEIYTWNLDILSHLSLFIQNLHQRVLYVTCPKNQIIQNYS